MSVAVFKLGLDTLLEQHPDWIQGHRIGLVSHAAAVDTNGLTSAQRLHQTAGLNLTALFGPEHGFAGLAAAGELTADERHTAWGIPIYSLYGETRKPTPAMLEGVDTLIVDLQDLGARPYTYVSTLRLVLESAAEAGKAVIIADRPVPLPLSMDGPCLDSKFESFVGSIPAPMQYGMTQGETALWLAGVLGLKINLRVSLMQGYQRDVLRQASWPAWVPPSPRIRSWETACLFTCTVFGEALPALDYGSGTDRSFSVIGAPWLDATRLLSRLNQVGLPGIAFEPVRYQARIGLYANSELDGLRLVITDYARFRPVSTSVTILAGIQELHQQTPLWTAPGTRPEWFDKLYGSDTVRLALQSGAPASDIIASWKPNLMAFAESRRPHLLYSCP